MNWILNYFRMTCKDTSPLISEMMDHSLPTGRRLKLKIHLVLCRFCRYYKTQLEIIRKLAGTLGREESPGLESAILSPQARKKLQDLIHHSH